MERNTGVGIDLGTWNSSISLVSIADGAWRWTEGRDRLSDSVIPSAVFIDTNGHHDYGMEARDRQGSMHEMQRVLVNFKRLLRENQPIDVPTVGLIEPTALARGFLGYLKSSIERATAMPCDRAVVTVPSWDQFDTDYRSRLREVVMGAEPLFDEIAMVLEPDAVLYSLTDLKQLDGQTVLVFDMGGGTLDVSIRGVEADLNRLPQIAVGGSGSAGGSVTEALLDVVLDKWQDTQGFTFTDGERSEALALNFVRGDHLKVQLSGYIEDGRPNTSSRKIEVLFPGHRGEGQFSCEVQVAELRQAAEPIVEEAVATVEKVLAEAGLTADEVDTVFMVGGAAHLPPIRDAMAEFFGKGPSPLVGPFGIVDPSLAVCRGAAVKDFFLEEADLIKAGTEGGSANVPATKPIELEQKLQYPISLVVDMHETTETLVPAGALLPFGPEQKTFYVAEDGDKQVNFVLARGEGDPSKTTLLRNRVVDFHTPQEAGAELKVSWYVDADGEFTLTATDYEGRELGVITASPHREED